MSMSRVLRRSAGSIWQGLARCCEQLSPSYVANPYTGRYLMGLPAHSCINCTHSYEISRWQHAASLADNLKVDATGFEHQRQDSSRFGITPEGPLYLYQAGRNKGMYRPDPRQELTIQMLQDMYNRLREAYPAVQRPSNLTIVDNMDQPNMEQPGAKHSWWGGLSSMLGSGHADSRTARKTPKIRGLYMYGGVGVGKTMLMDLFAQSAPHVFKVERTHFHDFMLDVHAKLHKYKGDTDPLMRVAASVTDTTRVLCLDEFFVTGVADAMILNRLFGRMWDSGLVLVATSNRAPDKLYEGGLQRNLFMPFIHRLKAECVPHDMASTTDYRKLAQHQRGLYFVTPDRDQELYDRFLELAQGYPVQPVRVEVMMGRHLDVAQAADSVCLMSFEELCGRPVAAADYIALANRFHTLALQGVPLFSAATRPEAYRFVTLIDILYEHRIRLLCSAETLAFELFDRVKTQQEAKALGGAGLVDMVVDDNLGFAKDRTISRLTEMQSREYLIAHAQEHVPELLLALREAGQQ